MLKGEGTQRGRRYHCFSRIHHRLVSNSDLNLPERDHSPPMNSTMSSERSRSRTGNRTVSDVAKVSAISGAFAEPFRNVRIILFPSWYSCIELLASKCLQTFSLTRTSGASLSLAILVARAQRA